MSQKWLYFRDRNFTSFAADQNFIIVFSAFVGLAYVEIFENRLGEVL
jgi:hypothetical protein